MLATLELLPMWSGVDPDVELFASGDVAEEDDEWKGGHSLDGSTAPAPDAGQNLYGRSALVRSTYVRVQMGQSLGAVKACCVNPTQRSAQCHHKVSLQHWLQTP